MSDQHLVQRGYRFNLEQIKPETWFEADPVLNGPVLLPLHD